MIDIHNLLLKKDSLNQIVNYFVEKIKSKNEAYTLIGIDSHGLLLASIIAFKTGLPFSYLIPNKSKSHATDSEKKIEIIKKKVIIVTDVIVSFNTVNEAVEELINKRIVDSDSIEFIFSIFHRPMIFNIPKHEFCAKYDVLCNKFTSKLFVLNNSFSIEVCNKDKCIFRDNGINLYD